MAQVDLIQVGVQVMEVARGGSEVDGVRNPTVPQLADIYR